MYHGGTLKEEEGKSMMRSTFSNKLMAANTFGSSRPSRLSHILLPQMIQTQDMILLLLNLKKSGNANLFLNFNRRIQLLISIFISTWRISIWAIAAGHADRGTPPMPRRPRSGRGAWLPISQRSASSRSSRPGRSSRASTRAWMAHR